MNSNHKSASPAVMLLGVLSALVLMLAGGIFLQGWAERRLADEERTKVFERSYPELEAYRQQQEQQLSEYAWIDEEAGTVRLPVERAMSLVVEEAAGVAE